ncbi:uncharacterized protein LOC129587378 [Paramacrobiotus metropolitanus]|uniref:uncharacterized protein LOC129587378 n=1 Tax=Paramacrobiotus metropolitanus TaxID=2943436 RepID=UPI0024463641|nr:uncharacterized protein LOC129587378 [Paramacrobiotus metropolitanus]
MDAMSDSTTVLASSEDEDEKGTSSEEDKGISERESICASPTDTVDRASNSDYGSTGSSSAQSSPESSRLKPEPLPAIQENPLPKKLRDFEEITAKYSADAKQKFCAATQRPDYEATQMALSIPDKILVRHSPATGIHHVLVMGSVDFMMDPLPCPFAEKETACRGFLARTPHFLQVHLRTKHPLPNALLNFVCPCPAQYNGGQTCKVATYDPGDMNMVPHLRKYHAKYYATMCAALEPVEADEDPERVQKRLNYRTRARRIPFPLWTYRRDMLFPTQIIPDKIVIPTRIENGEIKYICNVDPCNDQPIGEGEPRAAFCFHIHMYTEHRKRFSMFTTFYHKCPGCERILVAAHEELETHVKAMHEELLHKGARVEYSEEAKQKLQALGTAFPSSASAAPSPTVCSGTTAPPGAAHSSCGTTAARSRRARKW